MRSTRTRFLLAMGCLLGIIALAAYQSVKYAKPRSGEHMPGVAPADRGRLEALNEYEARVREALALVQTHPASATEVLEAAVAQARSSGVLPSTSGWPTEGEQSLLKLYLASTDAKAAPFAEYLKQTYPSYAATFATTRAASPATRLQGGDEQ